jgi:hypothetical protein
MRRQRPLLDPLRRRLAHDRVDTRWWYWVAAVPAVFAFWVVAVAWVTVAVSLGPLADPRPVAQAAEISLVAFGGPFLALTGVFPFAVYADASAVLEADVEWRPARTPLTGAAAVGPLVAAGAVAVGLAMGDAALAPLWATVLGFLLTVPVAAYYLYERHENLGVA